MKIKVTVNAPDDPKLAIAIAVISVVVLVVSAALVVMR
jgi:hypothetical protein